LCWKKYDNKEQTGTKALSSFVPLFQMSQSLDGCYEPRNSIAYMGSPLAGAEKGEMGQILRKFAKTDGCDTSKKIPEVLNSRSEVLAFIEQDF
jgi:hypothetical protein